MHRLTEDGKSCETYGLKDSRSNSNVSERNIDVNCTHGKEMKTTFRTEADKSNLTQKATPVCFWTPHKEKLVNHFLK